MNCYRHLALILSLILLSFSRLSCFFNSFNSLSCSLKALILSVKSRSSGASLRTSPALERLSDINQKLQHFWGFSITLSLQLQIRQPLSSKIFLLHEAQHRFILMPKALMAQVRLNSLLISTVGIILLLLIQVLIHSIEKALYANYLYRSRNAAASFTFPFPCL